MKKLFISALFSFAGMFVVSAQGFEGSIEFRQYTPTDTVDRVFYVKGDKVRIDEIGKKSKAPEGTYIVDLKTSQMYWMSHARKMYMDQGTSTADTVKRKFDVKKIDNTKTVKGVKCSGYIVKNTKESTEITYWMAPGKYDFFLKLVKILNRKDKSSIYIQQLTGVDGMFPFLSSQVNLETNKEEVQMIVTKVEKKTIGMDKFEVPKDYQKFQK